MLKSLEIAQETLMFVLESFDYKMHEGFQMHNSKPKFFLKIDEVKIDEVLKL